MAQRVRTNTDVFAAIMLSALILLAALVLGGTDRFPVPAMLCAISAAGIVLQLAAFIWVKRAINKSINAQIHRLRAQAYHQREVTAAGAHGGVSGGGA